MAPGADLTSSPSPGFQLRVIELEAEFRRVAGIVRRHKGSGRGHTRPLPSRRSVWLWVAAGLEPGDTSITGLWGSLSPEAATGPHGHVAFLARSACCTQFPPGC